jgi:hypothetical protein
MKSEKHPLNSEAQLLFKQQIIDLSDAVPTALAISSSPLLSRKEAATYLGLSERTLAVWACTGRYNLEMVKIGRLAKYRKSSLDLFIQERVK